MEHIPFITDRRRKQNLLNLAVFLAHSVIPDKEFDMQTYSAAAPDEWVYQRNCGSGGCAIGFNTFLIPKKRGEGYTRYSAKHLINPYTGNLHMDEFFYWLFTGSWISIDNTPEGAAQRIIYLLTRGLPENHEEILEGVDPLPYTDIIVPKVANLQSLEQSSK